MKLDNVGRAGEWVRGSVTGYHPDSFGSVFDWSRPKDSLKEKDAKQDVFFFWKGGDPFQIVVEPSVLPAGHLFCLS